MMYVIAPPFVPDVEGRLNQTKVQVTFAKIGQKKKKKLKEKTKLKKHDRSPEEAELIA